jgi:hypothetical protein
LTPELPNYLKPDLGGKLPAASLAPEVLLQVDLAHVLHHGALARVALGAVRADELPLLEVDTLELTPRISFGCNLRSKLKRNNNIYLRVFQFVHIFIIFSTIFDTS